MSKTGARILGIAIAIVLICIMFGFVFDFTQSTGVRLSGPFMFITILILWGVPNLVLKFFGYEKEVEQRDEKYENFIESKMSEKRKKGWLIFFIIFVLLLCVGAFLVSI